MLCRDAYKEDITRYDVTLLFCVPASGENKETGRDKGSNERRFSRHAETPCGRGKGERRRVLT